MTLRVVTLAGDAAREPSIAVALSARSDVDLLMRCVDRVELLAAIRSGRVDAIVSVGFPVWFDHQCRVEAAGAAIRVVALGGPDDDGWSRWAVVLPLEATADDILAGARDAILPVPDPPSERDREGRIVAVWGPKGAPGRTRIAVELACEVSSRTDSCLLIDADPYGGDVAQMLGLVEELPTIIWAARLAAKGELTREDFVSNLRRIGSDGPTVVPGIPRAELWAEISDFAWRELLHFAARNFSLVVVDVGFCLEPGVGETSQGRNRLARTSIELADRVISVCRPDPAGLKNFIWAFDELTSLTPRESTFVVLNRAQGSEARDAAGLLRRHIGKNVVAALPDMPEVAGKAMARGLAMKELNGQSEFAGTISSLTAILGFEPAHRGMLTRLAGAR